MHEQSEVIDIRVANWSKAAQSRRPSLFHGGMARHIVKQCTPSEEGVIEAIKNEPSPFRDDDLSRAVSKKEQRIQHEHEVIVSVALDECLDLLDIVDPHFSKTFDTLEFIKQNPGATETYREAITYLRRLFIQREQNAKNEHQPNTSTIDFMLILNRLLDDL